ncbi:triose-phosphate isomerase family protein [Glaciihabitans sp. dw_435]|uniref:triose-phosphate isomerase family protein n=1 Tax=Glaciihabitans sp. dw_435 TaxID=2720081 RepID=UPI001BD352EB|nr:triose-phosphate isomerase family protein [Glaciihabitans sp. dw_435]
MTATERSHSTVTVGVSLKMYFGHAQSLDWSSRVAELARTHPSVASGAVELFVIPDFLAVAPAVGIFAGTGVLVGAQDLATDDSGAFTGEVSGAVLAEVGASVVEVGHAERRRLFGETDAIVAAKSAAALRNGLAPVLCIGEGERMPPADASAECIRQLDSALAGAAFGRVIVAYEPVWAIGAPAPAPADHIRAVCAALRSHVDGLTGRDGSVVIYGGSAGPGLLTELGGDADGLFLGRFAHDPAALGAVLDEAAVLASSRTDNR